MLLCFVDKKIIINAKTGGSAPPNPLNCLWLAMSIIIDQSAKIINELEVDKSIVDESNGQAIMYHLISSFVLNQETPAHLS